MSAARHSAGGFYRWGLHDDRERTGGTGRRVVGPDPSGRAAQQRRGCAQAVTSTIVDLGIAEWVGITERVGANESQSLAITNELVGAVDELQYSLREGPCVQAAHDEGLLHSPDVADDP